MFPVEAETEKSIKTLVDGDGNGWSGGVWFPKSICFLTQISEKEALMKMPTWFYDKTVKIKFWKI